MVAIFLNGAVTLAEARAAVRNDLLTLDAVAPGRVDVQRCH